ncbi:MAG: dihydroorotase, partial [Treponema sp.]|nr:dihydroorotase [Treponema sp.]
MEKSLLIYNARLVDRDMDVKKGAVLVRKGRIEGFPSADAVKEFLKDSDIDKMDAKGMVLMPSFIDMHVHMRDPG